MAAQDLENDSKELRQRQSEQRDCSSPKAVGVGSPNRNRVHPSPSPTQDAKRDKQSWKFSSKEAVGTMAVSDAMLRRKFDLMDLDGNGTIDQYELESALRGLGKTDEQIREMEASVLKDGVVELSFAEFKALWDGTEFQSIIKQITLQSKWRDDSIAEILGDSWHDKLHEYINRNTVYARKPFTINPHHPIKRIWDTVVLCLVVYGAVSTPLQIGFDLDPSGGWMAIEVMVDAVFWVDLIFNFISGYDDGPLHVVYSHKLIAIQYLRRWFWIDILGVLPFELILTKDETNEGGSELSKLIPLVKTFRLLRLGKIARFLQAASQAVIRTWRVLRLAFGLILVSHLLACTFAMIELQFMESITSGGMPTNFNAREPMPWNELPVSELYPQVLYVGVALLVGDAPQAYNGLEAWFFLIGLLIGCTVFSVFFGEIQVLIQDQNKDEIDHRRKMDEVNAQMEYWKLRTETRDATREYYEYLWHKFHVHVQDARGHYAQELNPNLRLRTTTQMFKWIRNVDLFDTCEPEFLDLVMLALRPRVYLTEEYVFEVGSKGEGMFFLVHGVVVIVTDQEKLVCALHEGAYFGEIALFTDKAKRMASIVCAVPCSCYFLHRADFEEACQSYPDTAQSLQTIAVERFQAIFDTLDAERRFALLDEDGSGSLTKQELKGMLQVMKFDFDDESFERMFAEMDVDGDGEVNLKEFLEYSGLEKERLERIRQKQEEQKKQDEVVTAKKPGRGKAKSIINDAFKNT
jgi:Ca2+-binding EF-hand superfamily protein